MWSPFDAQRPAVTPVSARGSSIGRWLDLRRGAAGFCGRTLEHRGNTGDTFEFLSSHTSFRCGTGLPGLAWDKQAPVFMPDLGRGSGFLRADSALKVGINRGFAMPCGSVDGQVYVLACLSALATPIASQVDVWQPDALQSHLAHSFSFSETPSETAPPLADKLPLNDGVVGSVFATGVPVLDGQRIVCPVAMQDHITAVMALSL